MHAATTPGKWIKRKRRALLLGQGKFSKKIGVHIRTIKFWEADHHLPELKHRKKLNDVFGENFDWSAWE